MEAMLTRLPVLKFTSTALSSKTMPVTALPIEPRAHLDFERPLSGPSENFGGQTGESLKLKLNLG